MLVSLFMQKEEQNMALSCEFLSLSLSISIHIYIFFCLSLSQQQQQHDRVPFFFSQENINCGLLRESRINISCMKATMPLPLCTPRWRTPCGGTLGRRCVKFIFTLSSTRNEKTSEEMSLCWMCCKAR